MEERTSTFFSTGWELLQEQKKSVNTIITFCEKMDEILGGGIRLGRITELAGPASIGKTQIWYVIF